MAEANYIFNQKYNQYKSTLKETSFDKEKKEYLCSDESQKVYDFDLIVKDRYPSKQPSSYDSLLIEDSTIYCIEFKNQRYSNINREEIEKKLKNGKEVVEDIFTENNIQKKDYKFIYCVAYKNSITRWQRGIEKNEIQFELQAYKGKYFDEILTNDIQFFTNEYKKHFNKDLTC